MPVLFYFYSQDLLSLITILTVIYATHSEFQMTPCRVVTPQMKSTAVEASDSVLYLCSKVYINIKEGS